jgi:hypothetical protein
MKPKFMLLIDLSGIINCNTFSVVTSIINENAKKMCDTADCFATNVANVNEPYDVNHQINYICGQGSLTEGGGSVQLTS